MRVDTLSTTGFASGSYSKFLSYPPAIKIIFSLKAFIPDKVLVGEELAESLYHLTPSISLINSILCSTGLNSFIASTATSISTKVFVAAKAVAIF